MLSTIRITGTMKPGAVMGNHYHKETTIFFYLTTGSGKIDTIHVESKQTDSFTLNGNEGVLLKPFESHTIRFLEPSDFVMLKSIAYDPDSPDTYHFPVEEQPES